MLATTLSTIFGTSIPLHVTLHSKDLLSSLSTKLNSIDKSIRSDVNVIRFQSERSNESHFIWIPCRKNRAGPGTKYDSPLTDALQLLLHDVRLPIYFPSAERCEAGHWLGYSSHKTGEYVKFHLRHSFSF